MFDNYSAVQISNRQNRYKKWINWTYTWNQQQKNTRKTNGKRNEKQNKKLNICCAQWHNFFCVSFLLLFLLCNYWFSQFNQTIKQTQSTVYCFQQCQRKTRARALKQIDSRSRQRKKKKNKRTQFYVNIKHKIEKISSIWMNKYVPSFLSSFFSYIEKCRHIYVCVLYSMAVFFLFKYLVMSDSIKWMHVKKKERKWMLYTLNGFRCYSEHHSEWMNELEVLHDATAAGVFIIWQRI